MRGTAKVRLLLDTHALLWWLLGEASLSNPARAAIADDQNDVFVSAICAWEVSIKFALGKLPTAGALVANFEDVVTQNGFIELPVTIVHARNAGSLPQIHRDPFDRMLVAQAIAERLAFVSNETLFDAYGVGRLW